MYSEKMVKKLNHLKTAIKTASNKGGVRMAVEMTDINQALSEYLEALNEGYQKLAEEESEAEDEEEAQRATYALLRTHLQVDVPDAFQYNLSDKLVRERKRMNGNETLPDQITQSFCSYWRGVVWYL